MDRDIPVDIAPGKSMRRRFSMLGWQVRLQDSQVRGAGGVGFDTTVCGEHFAADIG